MMMRKLISILIILFLSFTEGLFAQCVSGNCENGRGTYISSSGGKYSGSFKNQYRHGQGTFTWSNGDRHEGYWENGEQNGKGIYYFAATDSIKVEGTWVNGTLTGRGKQFFRDGDTYEGDFKEGLREGTGTYHFKESGNRYSGEFKEGEITGKGTSTLASGARYVGEMVDSKRNGLGIFYYKNGTKEEGMWVNDEFSYPQKISGETTSVAQKKEDFSEIDNQIIPVSSGTAFAVSRHGHLLTNHHVIKGCQEISLRFNGRDLYTDILSFDPVNDLALLKINRLFKNPYSINTENPKLMQEIYVAGYPFGDSLSTSIKITKGIVSSLTGIYNNFSNIQIDAALQPGNSGGPIFDNSGNVVAVAVSKVDLKFILNEYGTLPENVNFGIKSSVIKDFLISNNVSNLPKPNTSRVTTRELSEQATDSTYYLDCFMTIAQAKKLISEKVIYTDFIDNN